MRRLLLLSGVVYGLLFLGLVTLRGDLVALAIPVAVYLGAAFLYGPQKPQLRATRILSAGCVSPDESVVVRLSVVNEGSHLDEVFVQDVIPDQLEIVDGTVRALAALPPGGMIELEYTVRGRRGSFDFRDVQVTVSDVLGLFRRRVTIEAFGRLLFLPRVSRLRRVAICPRRTLAYAGSIPTRQGGSGVEFFGIREYQWGDPRRWINWRASARHVPTLFTNEFEQERIADVGLILDAREHTNVRVHQGVLFEHAVHAASSLADAFLNDGNRVGLLIYGWFRDWTVPGYGKTQREHILRALARARTGESMVFGDLDALPTRLFPARSQLVLVSPLCEDDLPMLVRLRARGYELLVISPDHVAFAADAPGSQRAVALAARIAKLERTLLLRRIRDAGIRIVDWQVTTPLDQAIRVSLGRVPFRFHGPVMG
jgi:uncharacterized protein (DUF58 family)